MESIAHDEGRFVALSASAGATTTQFIDTWHIRDHLDSLAYDQSNRYRFNGKEEQVTGRLGLIDYGARLYDNKAY